MMQQNRGNIIALKRVSMYHPLWVWKWTTIGDFFNQETACRYTCRTLQMKKSYLMQL